MFTLRTSLDASGKKQSIWGSLGAGEAERQIDVGPGAFIVAGGAVNPSTGRVLSEFQASSSSTRWSFLARYSIAVGATLLK